ncbi:MAG: YbbR-like domain-containing protein, partial [Lachnospiraceae bacterium]
TRTIDIVATVVNDPAAGYIVGDCKILPSTVTITGAQSLINSIGSVKAVVDVSNAKEDVVTTCELEVYNTNGKIISKEKLDMSRKSIDVKVSILPTKEVGIEIGHKGNVANGYILTAVEPETDRIVIAGDAYDLEAIEKIVIPADAIDVSGIDKDTLYEIELSKYLPEGIIAEENNIFKVNVRVEALNSKKIYVAPEDIDIINVADGYEAEIISDGINVTISGRDISLAGVVSDSLKPVIDLEGIQEGNHDVEVRFTSPEGCNISGIYRVSVQIVAKEA